MSVIPSDLRRDHFLIVTHREDVFLIGWSLQLPLSKDGVLYFDRLYSRNEKYEFFEVFEKDQTCHVTQLKVVFL